MALRVGRKVSLRRQMTPQRVAAAERRKATLRRVVTGSITLALIAVIGGGVYTWYMGEQAATMATTGEEAAPSRRVEIRPVRQDPNANVGVSVQLLTSPVKPGDNASMTVKTNQQATCTIEVEYEGVKSADSGLAKKTADDFGMVSWAWTVEATTPEGTWPVSVTCATKKKSGMVKADLVVKAS